jgi:hypothetical protein
MFISPTANFMVCPQIYTGVRESGTAPFCRLVTWLDRQMDNYARLIGRQIRAAGVGTHAMRAADAQLPRTAAIAAAAAASSATNSDSGPPSPVPGSHRGQQQQLRRGSNSANHGVTAAAAAAALAAAGVGTSKLDTATCTLFATVSIMLEEAFAAAARLNALGFPVGVSLCAHLTGDLSAFIDSYCRKVDEGITEAVQRDALQLEEYTLLPPEALLNSSSSSSSSTSSTQQKPLPTSAPHVLSLTTSAAAVAREIRDVLEYTLLLIEPPPAVSSATGGYYYAREHFIQLQFHIVKWVFGLVSSHVKHYVAAVRRRSEDELLTRVQADAARHSLEALCTDFMPAAFQWCEALLPEVSLRECAQAASDAQSSLRDGAAVAEKLAEGLPYVSVLSAVVAADDDDDVDDMAAF